jgi:hypothetical protein
VQEAPRASWPHAALCVTNAVILLTLWALWPGGCVTASVAAAALTLPYTAFRAARVIPCRRPLWLAASCAIVAAICFVWQWRLVGQVAASLAAVFLLPPTTRRLIERTDTCSRAAGSVLDLVAYLPLQVITAVSHTLTFMGPWNLTDMTKVCTLSAPVGMTGSWLVQLLLRLPSGACVDSCANCPVHVQGCAAYPRWRSLFGLVYVTGMLVLCAAGVTATFLPLALPHALATTAALALPYLLHCTVRTLKIQDLLH